MKNQEKCIFCEQTTDDMPLIQMKYKENVVWICPQHMPVIIHKTPQLKEIFPDVNVGEGVDVP